MLTLSAFLMCSCTEVATSSKPNVIIIMTDDQGSMDLNCYGAEDLQTPHMDRLAEKGVRFTQFYAGGAVCSPSRACLMTGKTAQEATAGGRFGEQVIMAEVFKEAGYATAHIGKWHLGGCDYLFAPGKPNDESKMPLSQGFDYSFGLLDGCIDNYSHFYYWYGPNQHDLWENGREIFRDGEYFPQMMAEKAEAYIKEHAHEPFFMYFAMNTPHYPLQPLEKWREVYRDLPMPRRDYAAFVSTTDEIIGKLLSVLDREKLRENTIIFFMSDQGHSCEERTFGGGGWAGPYRGCKASLFEGGIRVPAIISWEDKLPAGKVVDEVCHAMDMLPTLAGFAEVKGLPVSVKGKDLSEVITGDAPSPHEVLFWRHSRQWAVRKGDWKLIGSPHDPSNPGAFDRMNDSLFLVNLAEDISESTNLAGSEPAKLTELIQAYRSWEFAGEIE
jgi:arylsulfatase A-like enzyme